MIIYVFNFDFENLVKHQENGLISCPFVFVLLPQGRSLSKKIGQTIKYTLFFIRMLFFHPRLTILIFWPIYAENILEFFLNIIAYGKFRLRMY